MACDNLREAIAITTPEKGWASEFLNRAKVDTDLYLIRDDAAFQNLISTEPSALSAGSP